VILTFGKPFMPKDFSDMREMAAALENWMKERFKNKVIPRVLPQEA